MPLVDTALVLGDLRITRWGLVTVMNPDRTILREYQITPQQAQDVHTNKGPPPGVTLAEWQSGLVMVASRPCLSGECVANPDGTLIVNTGIKTVAGKIEVTLTKLQHSEWAQVDGKIQIEAALKIALGI